MEILISNVHITTVAYWLQVHLKWKWRIMFEQRNWNKLYQWPKRKITNVLDNKDVQNYRFFFTGITASALHSSNLYFLEILTLIWKTQPKANSLLLSLRLCLQRRQRPRPSTWPTSPRSSRCTRPWRPRPPPWPRAPTPSPPRPPSPPPSRPSTSTRSRCSTATTTTTWRTCSR